MACFRMPCSRRTLPVVGRLGRSVGALAAAILAVLAFSPTALADAPSPFLPESGTTIAEGQEFVFEAALGWVRVQFAADDQFSEILCDTDWQQSAFDDSHSWTYPGPLPLSEVNCPLAVGTYYWRAGWSQDEDPAPGTEEWGAVRSVNRSAAAMSGTAQVGGVVTAVLASWPNENGSPPTSFAYDWQRCGTVDYSTEVMRDGASVYYHLGDDGGSTEALDATGGENNGAFTNGVAQEVDGVPFDGSDGAARFDGIDDYVEVPDGPALDVGDAFTIEAWVRPAGTGSDQAIVDKGLNGARLSLTSSGLLRLAKAGVGTIATSTVRVPVDGAFHHVVATKNGTAVKLYIDGAQVTGAVTNRTITDTAAPLQIGRQIDGGVPASYYAGELDELALYRGAMPSVRVRAHVDVGFSGCIVIAGAHGSSYTVTSADYGAWLRAIVTATYPNNGPVVAAPSDETVAITTHVPVNEDLSVVWGEAQVGEELTAGEGAWAGDNPLSYAFQWQSCQDRQYRTTVLADNPAGYWRLGELSGQAVDSSGNGNPGTYTGGVTRGVQGALLGSADTNRGSRFDGVNDYVQVADSADLDLGDSLTIEEWVRRNVSGIEGQIVMKGANGYGLLIGTDDRVLFQKSAVGAIAKSTITIPTDGNYHHVVATKNGATTKIYVDGVDVTQVVQNRTITNTTAPLQIGRFYNPATGATTSYLDGDLDEVAVYDAALSLTTVRKHYEMGTSGCTNIGGATSSTYTPQAGDTGKRLRVVATATNAVGSGSAASERTVSPVISSAPAPMIASGTLTTSSGTALVGADVRLYMWPSDLSDVGDDESPVLTLIDDTQTDASGNYVLQSDLSPAIQAEADENGGVVNFEIRATDATTIYNIFLERNFGAPDGEALARGGQSLSGASAIWLDSTEGLPARPTAVAMLPGDPGVAALAADPPNSPYQDRCSDWENTFKSWIQVGQGHDYVRVGELQSWLSMRAGFEYGRRAHSSIEIGVKPWGQKWGSSSGSVTVANERSDVRRLWENSLGTPDNPGGNVQRAVKADFNYKKMYQCWTGKLMHRASAWDGSSLDFGVRVNTRNGECSELAYEHFGPGEWEHSEDRAIKWGVAGQLGPVNVGASSGFSSRASTLWEFGGTFATQVLCGVSQNPINGSPKRVFGGY